MCRTGKISKRYKEANCKNGSTHLELDVGNFCTKAQFRQSFANQKFELQDDVSATAPTTMLNEYLKTFDDDGWLISTTDKDGYKDTELSPEVLCFFKQRVFF